MEGASSCELRDRNDNIFVVLVLDWKTTMRGVLARLPLTSRSVLKRNLKTGIMQEQQQQEQQEDKRRRQRIELGITKVPDPVSLGMTCLLLEDDNDPCMRSAQS